MCSVLQAAPSSYNRNPLQRALSIPYASPLESCVGGTYSFLPSSSSLDGSLFLFIKNRLQIIYDKAYITRSVCRLSSKLNRTINCYIYSLVWILPRNRSCSYTSTFRCLLLTLKNQCIIYSEI